MTNVEVLKYVHAVFEASQRFAGGTAPAYEWWTFINRFNVHDGNFILSDTQIKAFKPYCEKNQDLEMTPDEFLQLILAIRNEKQKTKARSSKIMESPASTTTSGSSGGRPVSYFNDKASINHPDSTVKKKNSLLNAYYLNFVLTCPI